MPKQDTFTAKYEVDDGYAGGSRPQTFRISPGDYVFEEDADDDSIREAFYEAVDENMRQRISACNTNADEFVAWIREQMKPKE